jgi:leucyl aminopeptidase
MERRLEMEIKAIAGDITTVQVEAIITFLLEAENLGGDVARVDEAGGGAVAALISQGEIKGKLGEITVIHSLGRLPATRVVIAGLGKMQELTQDRVRGVMADVCRHLQRKRASTVAASVPVIGLDDPERAAQVVTEGSLLGTYSFRRHITSEAETGDIEELTVVTSGDVKALQRVIDRGRVLAEATNLARDMVNEPGNFMTPGDMAEMAAKLAETYQLELEVLEREQMQTLGMGGLLGVAQGSQQPPKFIVLRYRGRDSAEVDIALVGKGITFDSGGISIKPSEKMEEMKGDMAGGAAVMAAVGAVAQLKPGLNVAAIVPATENLPSGSALKPGDTVTAMNGKTIEIISTDAEGRLILADALAYAGKLGVKRVVDVATLTGSMRAALGDLYTGAFGNNQELTDKVIAAGNEAGEPVWQMPLVAPYKEQIKSEVADIKNVGSRWGGSITAALFLAEFVGDTPWVHLDIAGTYWSEKEQGYYLKGATGVPVRTLVNLVQSLAK